MARARSVVGARNVATAGNVVVLEMWPELGMCLVLEMWPELGMWLALEK